MLNSNFSRIYDKFKLMLYDRVFRTFGEVEDDSLTTFEVLCMEIIGALKEPTVNEFAEAAQISSSNATYRINQIIKKGYVEKIRGKVDRREYYLVPTKKYADRYGVIYDYIDIVCDRIRERFDDQQVELLTEMLGIVANELTPEADSFLEVAKRNGNLRGKRDK